MSPNAQFTGGAVLAALTNPAADFPQITVGGEAFELRYTFRSGYFLETQCGIPAHEISAWISKQYDLHHITTLMMTMTGAMLGRIDPRTTKWQAMPISGQDLADRVLPAEWNAIMAIYTEALKKVSEGLNQAREALLAKTPEPTPTPTPEVVN